MKNILKHLMVLALCFSITGYGQKKSPIDLRSWSLSVPEGAEKGYKGADLLNFDTNPKIQYYFFNDPKDRSLVLYSPLKDAKGTPTKTVLREQTPFGKNMNWTLKNGASIKITARIGLTSVIKDKYPKVVFAQIMAKLTTEQIDLVGKQSTPKLLNAYWEDGKVTIKSSILRNENTLGDDLLKKESWREDQGFTFKDKVDFDKIKLEIKIDENKMVVKLNGETKEYNSISYKKMSMFHYYTGVQCEVDSDDSASFANLKLYKLEVTHP